MQRTKIEWVRNQDGTQGYTVNPVKGYCPVACSYCYARAMYDRFKWDKTIRFDIGPLTKAMFKRKPQRIFVGSTIELFGEWVPDDWLETIMKVVRMLSQHTFIFLTKRPENLAKWEWPDNAWVGVTATQQKPYNEALKHLENVQASIKFVSFEPLLGPVENIDYAVLDWLIVGTVTGQHRSSMNYPSLNETHRWAKQIIVEADSHNIPVFLKDNLKWPEVRREFPKEGSDDSIAMRRRKLRRER